MRDLMDMSETEALRAENTHLRAALATSKDPCIYCQLPAEEMAKCRAGFPGCARADDMTGCPEFGSAMEAHDLRAEVARLSALVPRWVPVGERFPTTAGDYRVYGGGIEGRHGFHPKDGWAPTPIPPTHWLEVPLPPLPGTEP